MANGALAKWHLGDKPTPSPVPCSFLLNPLRVSSPDGKPLCFSPFSRWTCPTASPSRRYECGPAVGSLGDIGGGHRGAGGAQSPQLRLPKDIAFGCRSERTPWHPMDVLGRRASGVLGWGGGDTWGAWGGGEGSALSPQLALLYEEVLYTIRHRMGKPEPHHVADAQELYAYVQKVGAACWYPPQSHPVPPVLCSHP